MDNLRYCTQYTIAILGNCPGLDHLPWGCAQSLPSFAALSLARQQQGRLQHSVSGTTAENGSQLEKAATEHRADFVGNSGTRKWLRFGIF
jgi:hypothetical protein